MGRLICLSVFFDNYVAFMLCFVEGILCLVSKLLFFRGFGEVTYRFHGVVGGCCRWNYRTADFSAVFSGTRLTFWRASLDLGLRFRV